MNASNLPSRDKCFQLLREYHVPAHIVEHILSVCRLGVFLAQKLIQAGEHVDAEFVERACLLHDIARVCDFKELDYSRFRQEISEEDKAMWRKLRQEYGNSSHEQAAYDILAADFPEVAELILKHKYMGMLDEADRPRTWEEKIVFYSDMRVMHDKIVPLRQRLEEAHKRNVHMHGGKEESRENTAKVDPLIYKLQQELFSKIALEPQDVTEELIAEYEHGNNQCTDKDS